MPISKKAKKVHCRCVSGVQGIMQTDPTAGAQTGKDLDGQGAAPQ